MTQDTLVIQRATSQQVRTISSRRIRAQEGIQQGHTTFFQVPITSISHLEVSRGQYRNMGKGLIIGLGVGAVFVYPSQFFKIYTVQGWYIISIRPTLQKARSLL